MGKKIIVIGQCPRCGYKYIQLVRNKTMFYTIDTWDEDEQPDRFHFDYSGLPEPHFPDYYCPECGNEFNVPDFIESEDK